MKASYAWAAGGGQARRGLRAQSGLGRSSSERAGASPRCVRCQLQADKAQLGCLLPETLDSRGALWSAHRLHSCSCCSTRVPRPALAPQRLALSPRPRTPHLRLTARRCDVAAPAEQGARLSRPSCCRPAALTARGLRRTRWPSCRRRQRSGTSSTSSPSFRWCAAGPSGVSGASLIWAHACPICGLLGIAHVLAVHGVGGRAATPAASTHASAAALTAPAAV